VYVRPVIAADFIRKGEIEAAFNDVTITTNFYHLLAAEMKLAYTNRHSDGMVVLQANEHPQAW
jgi:hypothetical protein